MAFCDFYYLIFYKLYKLASWTRSKDQASLVASFLIGFLIVQWSVYILAALKIKKHVPTYLFWLSYSIMIIVNILFFFRNHKYEKIIDKMRTKEVPVFFHVIIYLLMSWTFIGIVFL